MESKGLEGVVASRTGICFIDGKQGRMIYRGYDIHDLAVYSGFEETGYLLWHGVLPTKADLAALDEELAAHRKLPGKVLSLLRGYAKDALPMDALRTTVSALASYDPDVADNSHEANVRKAVRLTAQMATATAAYWRLREEKELINPNPKLSHAANFLYMLTGHAPDPLHARAFDIALILQADHELNASTFAARVTAATLSDMHSAVTSAIGTLKGPLHGGANQDVMRMMMEIGEVDRAADFIREKLAQKAKIPGFGHRVYKTEDPRATHLRRLSQEIGQKAGYTRWFEMSRRIETTMMEEKKLYCNVDFYSASVYHTMGIPIDLFTPIFACSRISGWTAHLLEQYADNRLIRPVGEYTGETDLSYVPIDTRG
ncbi:MAG: citrate synthase [candidate division Zixibacteria bacterium]|nr:citrate synthase [candidate division Zixibacteria bacterium]